MSQSPIGQPDPQPYGQQPPPPAPPAPKKRKKWPFVLGAIVLLIVVIAVANGGSKTSDTPTAGDNLGTATAQAPAEKKADKRVVVYEVTGAATANNITYTTDGMTSTEQVGQVPLPWSKTIELPTGQALQMVSVLAQAGEGTPEIAAKITVDGVVVKEGKSSGQFAIVSVNENIGSLK